MDFETVPQMPETRTEVFFSVARTAVVWRAQDEDEGDDFDYDYEDEDDDDDDEDDDDDDEDEDDDPGITG
jgi:hypothetical protein